MKHINETIKQAIRHYILLIMSQITIVLSIKSQIAGVLSIKSQILTANSEFDRSEAKGKIGICGSRL